MIESLLVLLGVLGMYLFAMAGVILIGLSSNLGLKLNVLGIYWIWSPWILRKTQSLIMPDNFVKLKDQPGFKRLMHLVTVIAFVPFLATVLIAINGAITSSWEDLKLDGVVLMIFMTGSLGLLVYGAFRIIYWVIDGFRQGFK